MNVLYSIRKHTNIPTLTGTNHSFSLKKCNERIFVIKVGFPQIRIAGDLFLKKKEISQNIFRQMNTQKNGRL